MKTWKEKIMAIIAAIAVIAMMSTCVLTTIVIERNRANAEMAKLERQIRFEYDSQTFVMMPRANND